MAEGIHTMRKPHIEQIEHVAVVRYLREEEYRLKEMIAEAEREWREPFYATICVDRVQQELARLLRNH